MTPRRWLLAAAVAALAAGGCAVRPGEPADGPGAPIDADAIPPAVPRDEPRSRYGNPESYVVDGRRYHVRDSARGYVREGTASWYGRKFHGRRTSSGETYNMYTMSAAHRTLPLPTYARVTNLDNGRSAVVRVNDRGPFVGDRLIDLSYAAATRLGVVGEGTARVRVRALDPGVPAVREGRDPPGNGDLFAQVGAFRERDNADRLRARLERARIGPVRIERASSDDGATLYRVRIGPVTAAGGRGALVGRLEELGIRRVRFVTDAAGTD